MPSSACTAVDNHRQFLNTPAGNVIQALNSGTGASISAFKRLVQSTQKCPACLCQFSREGYMGHLGLKAESYCCLNTPGCPIGESKHFDFSHALICNRHPVTVLPPPSPCPFTEAVYSGANLQTVIGYAWSAWNSRLGIPDDVWAMISTGVTSCLICHRVRIFEIHRRHDIKGKCVDQRQKSE
jgi:hypothetical protein